MRRGLLCAMCCPRGMPSSAGAFRPCCHQAGFAGAGVTAQQRTSVCPAPQCEAGCRSWALGMGRPLPSSHSECFSVHVMLLPAFGAFLQTKPKMSQHALHSGVVEQPQRLRSLFCVFTCLDRVHLCFVGSLFGCTNSVRQNHQQVLVQPM